LLNISETLLSLGSYSSLRPDIFQGFNLKGSLFEEFRLIREVSSKAVIFLSNFENDEAQ